jgi:hypothetical protein
MVIHWTSPSILLFIILLAYRLTLVAVMACPLQDFMQYIPFIEVGILTTIIVELSENKTLKKYSLSIILAARIIDTHPDDATW